MHKALGLELKPSGKSQETRRLLDLYGEYTRKRTPVDFVVVEDWSRYRITQGRTRVENSRLMQWCHRQITGKLKMLREAYGLIVVETPAAYSSHFCSISGQSGFRAKELAKDTFTNDFYWCRELERAQKEPHAGLAKALLAIKAAFDALPEGSRKTYLLPKAGGSVFVPAGEGAVRNAAVNLALRAIAAPDAFDIHSRVRSECKDSGYITRSPPSL